MPSARRVTKTLTQAPCVACVSVFVFNHFLSINNIQLAFSQRVVEAFEIFGVERLDLYEWNSGREWDPIHSYEAILGQISPTTVQKSN
jgi:hypothetical protein